MTILEHPVKVLPMSINKKFGRKCKRGKCQKCSNTKLPKTGTTKKLSSIFVMQQPTCSKFQNASVSIHVTLNPFQMNNMKSKLFASLCHENRILVSNLLFEGKLKLFDMYLFCPLFRSYMVYYGI